jgi:hypothetical protein
MPVTTIELTREHAAFLETPSLSRTSMGRCGPASRINSLSPCTMRSPRLTCCSDGKPRRRLLVGSKAHVSLELPGLHDISPYACLDRRSHSNRPLRSLRRDLLAVLCACVFIHRAHGLVSLCAATLYIRNNLSPVCRKRSKWRSPRDRRSAEILCPASWSLHPRNRRMECA